MYSSPNQIQFIAIDLEFTGLRFERFERDYITYLPYEKYRKVLMTAHR